MEYIIDILKGLIIGILYLFITRENDTSIKNILVFVLFYVTLANGAKLVGMDPNVVTTAFMTKSVFILVDQRIKVYDKQIDKK